MALFTHCVEFWREPRVALFNDVPGLLLPRFLIPNNPEDEKRNEMKLAGSSCQFDANTFHCSSGGTEPPFYGNLGQLQRFLFQMRSTYGTVSRNLPSTSDEQF